MSTYPDGKNWGDDRIIGTSFADRIVGGAGHDQLLGKRGSDTLIGNTGKDDLYGGRGTDTLFGGKNPDKLQGQDGKDKLDGGRGKDVLDGGAGNDSLIGGKQKDTFVFKGKFGKDTINDFRMQSDKLKINKTGKIKNIDDVVANAKQVGKDVVIDFGAGKKIVLKTIDLKMFASKADKFIEFS
jgi:serralysin